MIKYINNHYSSLTGKRLLGEFVEYGLPDHRIIQDCIDIDGISGGSPELHILLAEFLYLRTLNHDLFLQRLDDSCELLYQLAVLLLLLVKLL